MIPPFSLTLDPLLPSSSTTLFKILTLLFELHAEKTHFVPFAGGHVDSSD